jgi:putative Holliday junction resolvase
MEKVLAVDFGDRKCGLAISSEDRKWVFGRGIIGTENVFEKIQTLIEEEGVREIIVGRPLGLKMKETAQTLQVNVFCDELKKRVNVKVNLIDERLTSKLAQKFVKDRKQDDEMAARILLEGYLGI